MLVYGCLALKESRSVWREARQDNDKLGTLHKSQSLVKKKSGFFNRLNFVYFDIIYNKFYYDDVIVSYCLFFIFWCQ